MRSLRARVLVYMLATAGVATLLTLTVGTVLVRRDVDNRVVEGLERQAAAAAAALSVGAPAGPRVLVAGRGRPFLLPARSPRARQLLQAIAATGERSGRTTVQGRTLRFASAGPTTAPVTAVRLGGDGGWRQLPGTLLLAGAGGAAVAAALSVLLARRLTRPIRALSGAAAAIARGEEDVHVTVRGRDELGELADSFNTMAARLAAARETDRLLLHSVSHELKTPLAAIRGWAEALAENAVDPAEAAATIESEAGRLGRLVGDLLDLARLDRQAFPVELGPVDLTEIADQARARFETASEVADVTLAVEADAASAVLADAGRLLQCVSNLVENALRVTPAGGRITIRANGRLVAVHDTGPGLDGEDVLRAFDRFYLFSKYRQTRSAGSGLGLALVKELVEAMGGRVWVESEPGTGTTFTIELEQVSLRQERAEPAEAARAPSS